MGEGGRESALNSILLTESSVNASIKVCFCAFLTRYFRKRDLVLQKTRDVYYCLIFSKEISFLFCFLVYSWEDI